MVKQAVGSMSGGEKARLVLCMMVWQRPNLLLLDEPTNHLDLATREALGMALNEFEGTVMLVSHDRALLRAVCDEFWMVSRGGVEPFDGDLDDYQRYLLDEAKRQRAMARVEAKAAGKSDAGVVAARVSGQHHHRRPLVSAGQPGAEQRKRWHKELQAVEARMGVLQDETNAIEARCRIARSQRHRRLGQATARTDPGAQPIGRAVAGTECGGRKHCIDRRQGTRPPPGAKCPRSAGAFLHWINRSAATGGAPRYTVAQTPPRLWDSSGFAVHRDRDFNHHIGVQGHADGAVTNCFDRAVGHAHLGFGNLVARAHQLFGDIRVGNRAKQAAINARLLGELEGGTRQAFRPGLGPEPALAAATFSSSARLASNSALADSVARACATRGNQKVARVAVLDLDDFTEVAKVHYLVEQNDLHGSAP